jgi:hypothetical protein
VQNLSYSNIMMTNVENPVFITSYYPTLPTDPTTDPAQAVTVTTPQWENITLKNVTVGKSAPANQKAGRRFFVTTIPSRTSRQERWNP